MNFIERLHMIHRFWRYRLITEKGDIKFLLQQNLTGRVVIDIGANKGIYSYWMSKKVGENGRVIAFEPQPELEKHLVELKSAFKLHNLIIVNKGLSSLRDKRKLFRPEVGSGSASFNQHSSDWQSIEVDVVTLDEYYDNSRPIKFIKCDVEGHEYEVLKGSHQILIRDKPCLLFECHHSEAERGDIFSYLTGLSYDGFFTYKNKLIHFTKFRDFPYRKKGESHRNYIFLSKEA